MGQMKGAETLDKPSPIGYAGIGKKISGGGLDVAYLSDFCRSNAIPGSINMPYKIGLAKKRKKILAKELHRIIPEIIKMNVEQIIVFGSFATGNIHKSSDIDIIIIKETSKRFLDRLEEFYQVIGPRVGIDIFVYSPKEFLEMKKSNQFIKSALEQGRIIYEK